MKNNLIITNFHVFHSNYFQTTFNKYYPNINIPDKNFLQWFIGFSEGNLCFSDHKFIIKHKNIQILYYIQNKIGGKVKIRSGIKSYRYRLHDKKGIENLINNINGLIQQENRKKQLHNVCTVINIPTIESEKLTNKSN